MEEVRNPFPFFRAEQSMLHWRSFYWCRGKCSKSQTFFHFLERLYLYETYFYQLWPASDRNFTAMVRSSRKIPLKIAARCEGTVSNLGRRFLTRELRACARASYRYDVGNGICSLARSLARSIGRFLFFF